MSPAKKKTLLVDCDTGVDDAVALLYLLADPAVEICGITSVFGNISAATAARNSLWVLDVAGRTGQIPVARGSEVSLIGEEPELGTHVHGNSGLGGVASVRSPNLVGRSLDLCGLLGIQRRKIRQALGRCH